MVRIITFVADKVNDVERCKNGIWVTFMTFNRRQEASKARGVKRCRAILLAEGHVRGGNQVRPSSLIASAVQGTFFRVVAAPQRMHTGAHN